jgi:hypothetical protein
MKKISILIVLTAVTICSFSQVTDEPVKPLTKMDYLRKSKSQRTTGFVLLGSGVALDIIGLATIPKNVTLFHPDPSVKHKANTAGWLLIAGTATMLASVPFFVSAQVNKKKVVGLTINTQQIQQLNKNSLQSINYPALTMRVRL